MSGTNRLILSEAEGENESIAELDKDLLDANEAAIKECKPNHENKE